MTRRQCLMLLAVCPSIAATADDPWATVLRTAVDDQGRIDFTRLQAAPAALDAAVAAIAREAPNNAPARFPTSADRIAFHINTYNALAMAHVIRSGIPRRLSLLDRMQFFKLSDVVVGGRSISLYDYENDVIRPLGEERVHFALNCMAVSCPRLPRTPFTAANLDAELDAAARLFFSEPRNLQLDPARKIVRLSSILDFYTGDFLKRAPTLIGYANRYVGPPIPDDFRVRFIPYDWTINARLSP